MSQFGISHLNLFVLIFHAMKTTWGSHVLGVSRGSEVKGTKIFLNFFLNDLNIRYFTGLFFCLLKKIRNFFKNFSN